MSWTAGALANFLFLDPPFIRDTGQSNNRRPIRGLVNGLPSKAEVVDARLSMLNDNFRRYSTPQTELGSKGAPVELLRQLSKLIMVCPFDCGRCSIEFTSVHAGTWHSVSCSGPPPFVPAGVVPSPSFTISFNGKRSLDSNRHSVQLISS